MDIREKIKARLPEDYELVTVQRQSNHPKDGHLYLVEGRKESEYAVWDFNAETGNLFAGEYRLTKADALSRLSERTNDVYTRFNSREECDKTFEKEYGARPFQSFEVDMEARPVTAERGISVGE